MSVAHLTNQLADLDLEAYQTQLRTGGSSFDSLSKTAGVRVFHHNATSTTRSCWDCWGTCCSCCGCLCCEDTCGGGKSAGTAHSHVHEN